MQSQSQKNDLLVSVIIPTFKRPILLSRAIDSVLVQTYKSIEVVVVDDNEPDSDYRKETEALMYKYQADFRVKYLRHEKNKNGAAARNTGIRNSNGEIVAFLDDDDFFHPDKVLDQVDFLNKNRQFSGVYCGSFFKGREIIPYKYGDLSKELLLMNTFIFTPTIMIYKDIINDLNGFNEQFVRHQDYEFLLRFFHKYKIGCISRCLVHIGDNDGSNEPKGDVLNENKELFFRVFSKVIDDINSKNKGFKRRVYAKHYSFVFLSHLKNGYLKFAFDVFLKIFFYSPFYFTIYVVQRIFFYLNHKFYKISKK